MKGCESIALVTWITTSNYFSMSEMDNSAGYEGETGLAPHCSFARFTAFRLSRAICLRGGRHPTLNASKTSPSPPLDISPIFISAQWKLVTPSVWKVQSEKTGNKHCRTRRLILPSAERLWQVRGRDSWTMSNRPRWPLTTGESKLSCDSHHDLCMSRSSYFKSTSKS